MKKILFLGMGLFFGLSAIHAQQVKNKQVTGNLPHGRTCGVVENEKQLQQQNPQRAAERQAYEQQTQNYITQSQNNPTTQAIITIPVVVHVIYNTAAQNISDNQIFSQIQVLNEDFTRTNADAANIPSAFLPVAGTFDINFCLAQQDPNGVATTGIERRNTSVTSFVDDNVKSFSTGGLNAWDPSRYFNIWVCNLGGGLLGYAEFPTTSLSNTYGVVIGYSVFGSNYTSYGTFPSITSAYNRGRTTTHEVGHCLNLYHIWGDDGNSCSGSDLCSDTPNQGNENYGCPSYPTTDNCTGTNPGIMFMNYMDYTDDACMYMFTNNQKTRALAVLNANPYNALQTSTACTSPNPSVNDAAINAITTPNGTICGTTFVPVVVLKNWGSSTLTTCTIRYQIDATTLQTYTWTGSLGTGLTTNVTLPSMTTTGGAHTFTSFTQNPNGQTDANAGNDSFTSNFTCTGAAQSLPFFEGFEGTTFVPAGWSLTNPDASITWGRTTTCSKTGVACAKMDNYNYQGGNGQIDEMDAPPVNLSTVASPVLTFQVAYTYWTVPYQYSDTLEVLVSTNCGVTWTTVYQKWGAALQTGTPLSSQTAGWVPSNTEWRMETVSLLPYQTATSLIVKFRSITDFEDNLYVDDINIMNSTGMSQTNLSSLINLFPNPSTGIFNLNIALDSQKDLNVKIVNTLGQTVQQFAERNTYGGSYQLDLGEQPNGVYFVEVNAGGETSVQRIIVNR